MRDSLNWSKFKSLASISLLMGFLVLSIMPGQESLALRTALAQSLVEGRGKIIAVTPEKQQVVLEHGEIKGVMDAMTMGYKVKSRSMLKGLKAGDRVRFWFDPATNSITKVQAIKK